MQQIAEILREFVCGDCGRNLQVGRPPLALGAEIEHGPAVVLTHDGEQASERVETVLVLPRRAPS
ncbi:hypothetical protein K6W76_00250 [Burkholderia anthina]|nr:hypothetical protein [Burkholderia anthina]